VRGKLVEQRPDDEPAVELFKRIRSEKAELAHAGQINQSKFRGLTRSLSTNVPLGWMSVALGELLLMHLGGGTPSKSNHDYWDGPISWASVKDVGKTKYLDTTVDHITDAGLLNSSSNLIPAKQLLIATRMGLGKVSINRVPVAINQDLRALFLSSHVSVDYCYNFFLTHVFEGTGLTVKGIKLNELLNIPVPLPPLAEQHRIVAKINELMTLCDRLEETRNTREATRQKLTTASLTRLTVPDTDEPTFQTHARFVLNVVPTLTARPEQIKTLRQAILDLVVRGRLVEQDATDEPASVLLQQISATRADLLKADYPNSSEARTQEKKLAKQQLPDDLPCLPSGWSWATLQQCSLLVVDCKNKTAPYASSGIPLVRTTNVRDGKLNSNDQRYVDEESYAIWSARCEPEHDDILITREAPMGEVCLVPPNTRICLGQRIMLVRLVHGTIDPNFMMYSLRDSGLMERVQNKPLGMTVQHLRVGGVETLLVPLPPLAEQKRIVAKLNQLMAFCDQIEAGLTKAEETRGRLLESMLHEALRSVTTKQEAA
jgi:type I restriction enzyme S subunit